MAHVKSVWKCDGCDTEHERSDGAKRIVVRGDNFNGHRFFSAEFDSWECADAFCRDDEALGGWRGVPREPAVECIYCGYRMGASTWPMLRESKSRHRSACLAEKEIG